MKPEGTPAGMTAGGTWVEHIYDVSPLEVGELGVICLFLSCLFCSGRGGSPIKRKGWVYVNLGANAKPGPGKAALRDGTIVNY